MRKSHSLHGVIVIMLAALPPTAVEAIGQFMTNHITALIMISVHEGFT